MENNDWTTFAVPLLVLVGALFAQWLARSTEPRQLGNLKLLSDIITGYADQDAGKTALIAARQRFAQKVAKNFEERPWPLQLLTYTRYVLVAAVAVLWVLTVGDVVDVRGFTGAFFWVAAMTGVAIAAAVAEALVFRWWRNRV